MRYAIPLLCLLLLPATPLATQARTLEEIQACVVANRPEKTSVQTVVFDAKNRVGDVVRSEATSYWELRDSGLSRVLMRFHAPSDIRGSAVLMLEKEGHESDIFMYSPELQRVRRVTSRMVSGSVFGTDFSYEDLDRLLGYGAKVSSRKLEDAEVGGRAAYVVESHPPPEAGSAYEKVVEYIDQERCVVMKGEFFEANGELRKRLTADETSIRQVAGVWVPHRVVMADVGDGTETVLRVEKVEMDVPIPEKIFSTRELEARGR